MTNTKLLLTGATGFVGGTVLARLLASSSSEIRELQISVLVRKQEHADAYASKGLSPILFRDLNDTEALRRAAGEHDIIIHTADSTNPRAVEAFVLGLSDRAKKTSKVGQFLHLSGTSSLGDFPVTKQLINTREFTDTEDIYSYMKYRESIHSYTQRATDIKAVESGEDLGVKTYVVKAPRIYGRGTGLFNQKSAHIPWLIAGAVALGQAEYVGDGAAVWDDVHVADLADLFEIILVKILRAEELSSGRKGVYFAATLRHSWRQLAESIAKAGFDLGQLTTLEPTQISLEEAAKKYTGGDLLTAEVGLASQSLTIAKLAADLGWSSKMGEQDFQKAVVDDFSLLYPKKEANQPESYCALSYAWNIRPGQSPKRRAIIETPEGSRELRIHQSLEQALLSLDTECLLFVDQICINQADAEEKAVQVKMMREIYSTCSRTVIWLGPGTRYSDRFADYAYRFLSEGDKTTSRLSSLHPFRIREIALAARSSIIDADDSLREDSEFFFELVERFGNPFPLRDFLDILQRGWFTRLWTIQEACLSPDVVVTCGSRSLNLVGLRYLVSFYVLWVSWEASIIKKFIPRANLSRSQEAIGRVEKLTSICDERDIIQTTPCRRSIYDLVVKFATSKEDFKIQSTEPVDRIYGLIGLADPQSTTDLVVDYGDGGRRGMVQAASIFVQQNPDLLVFSQFPKKISGLPSWVPDWSMELDMPFGYSSLTADPIFDAGGPPTGQISTSLSTGELVLSGIFLDINTRVGQYTIQEPKNRLCVAPTLL
ncbi:hypothetical protein HJFPF1_13476 [Paramyrothecium foliicola]|nr:hypothetical protein HJFPF1_13476 [Paramyrothecium foliicola]